MIKKIVDFFTSLSVRWKLILLISILVIVLIVSISLIYIGKTSSLLEQQLESKRLMLMSDMEGKGVTLAKTISRAIENAIETYDFSFVETVINEAVANDKEVMFAIVMSTNRYVLAMAGDVIDDISPDGQLVSWIAQESAKVETIDLKKYRVKGRRVCEVVVPVEVEGEKIAIMRLGLTPKYYEQQVEQEKKTIRKIIRNYWLTTLLLIFVFISVGVAGAVALSNMFLKPIYELSRVAGEVAKRNFDISARIFFKDELGSLAETFNQMIGEIKDYSENLEELVRQRTRELEEANSRLKKANMELERRHKEMLRELRLAQGLQHSILPRSENLDLGNLIRFGSMYLAMESIGGDIYDVHRLSENKIGVLVADVSGHGVPAAMVTTMIKLAFITHSSPNKTTSEICSDVNRSLYASLSDSSFYITAFYLIYDASKNTIQFTNAGHRPAFLYRPSTDEIIKLDSKGVFLGVFEDAKFEMGEVSLKKLDKVVMYTDGVIEARNEKGEFFDEEGLIKVLKQYGSIPADDFVKRLFIILEEFMSGEPARDDITIVAFDINGKAS